MLKFNVKEECNEEVKARVNMAKPIFRTLQTMPFHRNHPLEVRLSVIQTYV